jgi:hypothetical protein
LAKWLSVLASSSAACAVSLNCILALLTHVSSVVCELSANQWSAESSRNFTKWRRTRHQVNSAHNHRPDRAVGASQSPPDTVILSKWYFLFWKTFRRPSFLTIPVWPLRDFLVYGVLEEPPLTMLGLVD